MSLAESKRRRQSSPALRWVALFCASAVWALGLLAVSPQLHEKLHADAGHQDHACAVTLFSHGVDDAGASADLTVVPLVALDEKVAPYSERAALAPRYWLLPGRAPPVS